MQLKYIFFIIILFFLNLFTNFHAQSMFNSDMSNEEIERKIDEYNKNSPTKTWELINFYIKKSKREHNNEALFYAYRYASITQTYPSNIKYADSALITAKKSEIKKIVLDAYLNRGNINMTQEFYQKALDDILVANKLSQESGNDYIFNQ